MNEYDALRRLESRLFWTRTLQQGAFVALAAFLVAWFLI